VQNFPLVFIGSFEPDVMNILFHFFAPAKTYQYEASDCFAIYIIQY